MSVLISGLSLLAIIYLGLTYLYGPKIQHILQGKGLETEVVWLSGPQKLLLLLTATGIVQAGAFSAALLAVWIAFLFLALFATTNRRNIPLPLWIYMLYIGWLLFSLAQTPVKDYGFRVLLKYLYPLLVALLAMRLAEGKKYVRLLVKWTLGALILANLTIILPQLLPVGWIIGPLLNPIIWWGPAVIDANSFSVALSVALYAQTRSKKYLYLIAFFCAAPVLGAIRTGILGVSVTLAAVSLFKYRWKALPFLVGAAAFLVVAIVYIPQLREKMFFDDTMTADFILSHWRELSTDDIDSSGRFAMWEWALAHYYASNPITGSGLGVLQEVFYAFRAPFGGMRIIHNDYVQILCDTGSVGLTLYLGFIFSFIASCFWMFIDKKTSAITRFAAFTAGVGLPGVMVTALTDNVVNYSLMTLTYPMIFYGIALANHHR